MFNIIIYVFVYNLKPFYKTITTVSIMSSKELIIVRYSS